MVEREASAAAMMAAPWPTNRKGEREGRREQRQRRGAEADLDVWPERA